jgi:hypothetical protein
VVPKIALIVCTALPTHDQYRGLIPNGSGQEVHLVGTQPDVNPTSNNLSTSLIALIEPSLAALNSARWLAEEKSVVWKEL